MGRAVVLLTALLASVSAVAASVTVPATFQEVVSEAGLIVRGRVTATRVITASTGEVSTVATVSVESVLKGAADSFVSVIVPGGEWGGTRTVMAGAPSLRPNDAAIFCLTRGPDGLWRPVGLAAGVFRVHRDPSRNAAVVHAPATARDARGDRRLVPGGTRARAIDVAEFESLVRLALGPRTARPRTNR